MIENNTEVSGIKYKVSNSYFSEDNIVIQPNTSAENNHAYKENEYHENYY